MQNTFSSLLLFNHNFFIDNIYSFIYVLKEKKFVAPFFELIHLINQNKWKLVVKLMSLDECDDFSISHSTSFFFSPDSDKQNFNEIINNLFTPRLIARSFYLYKNATENQFEFLDYPLISYKDFVSMA